VIRVNEVLDENVNSEDTVYIPVNAPHSARTLGPRPAHFILVYSAGDYEAHLEREASHTWRLRSDPKIKAVLRKLNDFNVPA